jgi:phage portal protein BeeE
MANIIAQIGRAIQGAAAGFIGGFRTATTRFWSFGNKEVYSPIEQDRSVSHGFNSNSAVYSIVKKYAKKAASIERYLENKKDDSEIENHPLQELLDRPNENQSAFSFFKIIYAYYKICGESFIWLNRGDVTQMVDSAGNLVDRTPKEYQAMKVIEMFVIPPNEIVITVDPNDPNSILGYFLRNNQQIRFRKEDIVHWKDVNLEWDELARPQLRGMTPLRPGSMTLAADNSFLESMLRMAQNDGARAIAYNKSLSQPTPTQQSQIENVFSDKVNNKDRKNQVQALQGDWGLLQLGLTSVDMDTLNAREFIYKELCFLLDVPYGFFDSHTPYAEKQLAARDWISNSIMPDVKELDGELNRMLLPAFKLDPKNVEICSDFDDLPELQDDKLKQVQWMNLAPLTPNEIREALDYEPITDPIMDEVFMPTGNSSIMSDLNMPPDQNIQPDANA